MVLKVGGRRPGMLARYDKDTGNALVESFQILNSRGASRNHKPSERTYPNYRNWTDEDLAELVARGGGDANTHLADIELRRRESWRTPARWSLLVSVVALIVAIVALVVGISD